MKLKLLGNRVLLRVEPLARRSVELVERWHPSANAVVAAVGSGVRVPLREGQRVGFRPMQGADLHWEGVNYRLVKSEDIVGVVGDLGVEVSE